MEQRNKDSRGVAFHATWSPPPRLRSPGADSDASHNALLATYGLADPLPSDRDEEAQQLKDLQDSLAAREPTGVDPTIPPGGSVHVNASQFTTSRHQERQAARRTCAPAWPFASTPPKGPSWAATRRRIEGFVVVLEIAPDPTSETGSEEDNARRLLDAKREVCTQLLRYMDRLSDSGGNVLGVAAIGLEVAFLRPLKATGRVGQGSRWRWYTGDESEDREGDPSERWFSIYGTELLDFLEQAKEY
ncbi:hypothetical protein LXA43DRAFT_1092406 [Ganoderma leucocontextum]|nr:hypothetical protein LXA43DRAFT_1092406 [Ganoderma leucocontextum]